MPKTKYVPLNLSDIAEESPEAPTPRNGNNDRKGTGSDPPRGPRFPSNRGLFRNGIGRGISTGQGEPVDNHGCFINGQGDSLNNRKGFIGNSEGLANNGGGFTNDREGMRDNRYMPHSTTMGGNIPATDVRQENTTTSNDNMTVTVSNAVSAPEVAPNPSEPAETSDSSTTARDEQDVVNEIDDRENGLHNFQSNVNELDPAVLRGQLSQARDEIIRLAKELKDYIRWKDICKEREEELGWRTKEMEHLQIRIVEERNARESADNSIKTLLKNNIEAQTFNILRLQRDAALDARDKFMRESERLTWKHENLILETQDIRESHRQCMGVRAELVRRYPEVSPLFYSHDRDEHRDYDRSPSNRAYNALIRYGQTTYPSNVNYGEVPSSRPPLWSPWNN